MYVHVEIQGGACTQEEYISQDYRQNPSSGKISLFRKLADKSLVHMCTVPPLLLLLLLLVEDVATLLPVKDINDVDRATRVLPAHVGSHIRCMLRPIRAVRTIESRQLTACVLQMMLEIVTPVEGPAAVGAETKLPAVSTFRQILAF